MDNALLVVALIVGVFTLAAALRRLGVAPETTRKLAHVGAGFAVLPLAGESLPSITALALIALFSVLIWSLRRLRWLRFLDDVGRKGPSEYGFILAIAILAVIGGDEPFAFRTAVLILGLADAAAALAGRKLGRHAFAIGTGVRSLEGSAAFAAAALGVTVGMMAAHDRPLDGAAFRAALILCVVTACVEAISTDGLDNLAVPLVAYLLAIDPELARDFGMCGIVLTVGIIITGALPRVRVPAAFGVALTLLGLAVAFVATGGWRWPLAACLTTVALAALVRTPARRSVAIGRGHGST